MPHHLTITILIPAYNEEKTIAQCIGSCLSQTDAPEAIIVVDDGSSDDTLEVLNTFHDSRIRVISLPERTGAKSHAQEIGIKHVETDVVITTDADTMLHHDFVKVVRRCFVQNPHVAAVAGAVESLRHNYLTALRDIDYVIGNDIFKRAQHTLGFLHVISGCAGGFRTSLFRDGILSFDHDTLTEDLDLTYKLHDQRLPILFEPNAVSYTQDPHTISSYINQMRRWYCGAWQNLRKHWGVARFPGAALVLTLSYIEGLVFSTMLIVLPLIDLDWFMTIIAWYGIVVLILGVCAAIRRNRLDVLFVSPLLIGMNLVHAYIFIEQFFAEIVFSREQLAWYSPQRRESKRPIVTRV